MVLFCVGMYAATVVIYFAWAHLPKRIYRLYLSREWRTGAIQSKLRTRRRQCPLETVRTLARREICVETRSAPPLSAATIAALTSHVKLIPFKLH